MSLFRQRFLGALRRVIPGCVAQTQAIAFNMFLASFPMMLLVLGAVATSMRLRVGLLDIVAHLRPVLPPGAVRVLVGFLARRGAYGWQWMSLGLGGTLLAGTQMMRLIIDGFQMVYGEQGRPPFWRHNQRALTLLVATMAPWFLTSGMIVFGKQMRGWMIQRLGWRAQVIAPFWTALYVAVVLALAMVVLAVVYRVGRPGIRSWESVLPGAALATLLWWGISSAFGLYVRHMPYGAVYGDLAAAIGLMLWMQLTSTIILMGAAFNAQCEYAATRQAEAAYASV
jgi:membrane protein